MQVTSRPQKGIRMERDSMELVDQFCYLGSTLTNNVSHEKDTQQKWAVALLHLAQRNACGRSPSPRKFSCEPTYPYHSIRIGILDNTIYGYREA
ncbi:hypothetical protein RB195_017455 [Necator americanus]|uniref:Uncharacterized protein n=1 Tax=Necator americanus TaxID=51031 RepID=A0ABR1C5B2_NECAM